MARADRFIAAVAAVITAATILTLGLRGGTFDIVNRQTAGLLLWWAVGLGALITTRGPQRPALAGIVATAFGLAIPVWIACGVGISISPERTAIELARWTVHLAPILLVGWLLPAHWWRSVVAGLTGGATILALLALGSRLSPGLLGDQPANVVGDTTTRLTDPLGYWNAVGSWCVLTVLLLLGSATHVPQRALRALAVAAIPAIVVTGSLTYSRSSIGALIIGLLVLLGASRNRWTSAATIAAATAAGVACVLVVHRHEQIADGTGSAGAGTVLLTLIVAGIALAVVAAMLLPQLDRVRASPVVARTGVGLAILTVGVVAAVVIETDGDRLWKQFNTPGQAEVHTTADRLTTLNGTRIEQWRVAIDAWRSDPTRGAGAGTFELINNQHNPIGEFVRDAHNAFVETLAEQGTIGLLLLVGFLLASGAAARTALRRIADDTGRGLAAAATAAVAAFAVGTAVDWFWEVTALALLALSLIGALIAATRDAGAGQTDLAAPQPLRTWPLRSCFAALALLGVLVQLPGLVGTSEVRRSQQAVKRGALVAARSHADQAIETMPWASSAYLQRALVDEQAGAFAAARRGLQLAIDRDRQDWRLPLVLARVEAEAGNSKAALQAYRDAKRLRPHGTFFR
ncbi:MAG: O-antigen ligase family protein [Patulibacter sp.]